MAVAKGSVELFERAIVLLKEWGWGPHLTLQSGWKTRSNGHKQPQLQSSVMVHHTGGTNTPTSYLLNPTDRPDLKLLANVHVTSSKIIVLAAGPSSHAGNGTKRNWEKLLAGKAPLTADMTPVKPDTSWSANRYSIGVEVNGAGGSKEWSEWTQRAVLAVCTAFQIAGKWGSAARVWGHKEFTTRKPGDPWMNMGVLRSQVAASAASGSVSATGAPPATLKLGDRLLSKDGNDAGPDVGELGALLTSLGYDVGKPLDVFGPKMDAAVRDFQGKAGLRVDGIVGEKTVAALLGESLPEEQPEPPVKPPVKPGKRRAFRLLFINTLAERFIAKSGPKKGYGVADTSSKWPKWLAKQKPSIMLLVETSEVRRNAIRKYFGMDKLLTYPIGFVTVMWLAAKWEHLAKKDHRLATDYHGAMRVTLRDKEGSGLETDVVSVHVRPKASFPASYTAEQVVQAKLKDLRNALNDVLRKDVATWVGGDFNTARHAEVMAEFGFVRATPAVDTVVDDGDQKLDAVWCRPGKKVATPVRGKALLDPGKLSDHMGWLVNATLEEKE